MAQGLRWAIIGDDAGARRRARAIARDPRSTLVAVTSAEVGQPVVTDTEALARADVIVLAGSECRPDNVYGCLDAGKHVVIDGPPSTTRESSRALYELAHEHGVLLHTAQTELLQSTALTLKAQIREISVVRVDASLEETAAQPPTDLAGHCAMLLHRIVHLGGPIASVDTIEEYPGDLRATLTLTGGATASVRFTSAPYFARKLTVEAEDHNGVWRQENDALYQGRRAQTLLEPADVHADDHAWATRRILDGSPSYLSEETVLHVLEVVEHLRDGEPGPVSDPRGA